MQRARVMKPKIKCKKVKITAEQMERIRAQEQEESIMQNTSKVTVKKFADFKVFTYSIILCEKYHHLKWTEIKRGKCFCWDGLYFTRSYTLH